jgi:hypothetical protein
VLVSQFFNLIGKDHSPSKSTFYLHMKNVHMWDATPEQKKWLQSEGAVAATSPSTKLATTTSLLQALQQCGGSMCSTLVPDKQHPTPQEVCCPSWAPPVIPHPHHVPSESTANAAENSNNSSSSSSSSSSFSSQSIPLKHPNALPPPSSLNQQLRSLPHKYSLCQQTSPAAVTALAELEPALLEFEAYTKAPTNMNREGLGILSTVTFTKAKKNIMQFLGFIMLAFNLSKVTLLHFLNTHLLAAFLSFLYNIR